MSVQHFLRLDDFRPYISYSRNCHISPLETLSLSLWIAHWLQGAVLTLKKAHQGNGKISPRFPAVLDYSVSLQKLSFNSVAVKAWHLRKINEPLTNWAFVFAYRVHTLNRTCSVFFCHLICFYYWITNQFGWRNCWRFANTVKQDQPYLLSRNGVVYRVRSWRVWHRRPDILRYTMYNCVGCCVFLLLSAL